MNCYDCAAHGEATDAVAVCTDCGAAICAVHAHLSPRWLTRTMVINRVVAVEPPARTIRCTVCQAARDARDGVAGDGHRPVTRDRVR